ncbi:MAG: translation initiation factor IF-2 subunit gamma [Candidatus Aenigmatarchaeota archaeon]
MSKKLIPEINIGLIGHVDHGKTSLVEALTGKWASTHSEELKRGITIRLGYADTTFYFCEKCKLYSTTDKCVKCFGECKPKRAVSFVDMPGHETLMATVLSGSALIDGALLIISADEKCPQPQTAEHLKVLDIIDNHNIIIVQNKIDIVTDEQAMKNYNEIKTFVKGTVAENAPIIPVSALHRTNIDILIETIEERMTTPERDLTASPKLYIARSFDINKPGSEISKLRGGVLGGSITKGKICVGDEIEIRPGVKIKDTYSYLRSKVIEIIHGNQKVQEATPGGLVSIQTELDPGLTRGDTLSGNFASQPDKLPQNSSTIKFKIELFDHIVGVENDQKVSLHINDALLITQTIAKTVGIVTSMKKEVAEVKLKIPLCVDKDDKIALSKQVSGRWHLIGWGKIM